MSQYLKVVKRGQPVQMFKPGQEPESSFARCYEQTTNSNEIQLLEMPTMNFGTETKNETKPTTYTVNGCEVRLLDLPKMQFGEQK